MKGHAQSWANVITSISKGQNYNKNNLDDELDAKYAAANYEIYKGGKYLKHGQASLINNSVTPKQGLITSLGKVNATLIQNIANNESGTIRDKLRADKVVW